MGKTKESIELKWKRTYEAFYSKIVWERRKKTEELKERSQNDLERKLVQLDRKINARLRRKKEDCDKKCKNEIRQLE